MKTVKILLVALCAFLLPLARATVPSSTTYVQYTLTTNPQTLTVPFVFQATTDLLVLDTRAPAAPVTLTISSDYSVTGGSGSTGTVVTIAGGAHGVLVGDVITISRAVPLTQTTTFTNGGPLTASMIGASFDKITQIAQQINLNGSRSLQFGGDETASGVLPLTARKGTLLGFDATTGAVIFVPGANVPNLTITGTANQVLVNGTSGSARSAPWLLTTPQDIGTGSSPTFAGLTLGALSGIGNYAAGVAGTATIGNSLSYSGTTLNTIQGIRTADSPTFTGLTAFAATGPFITAQSNAAGGSPQLRAVNDQSAAVGLALGGSTLAGTTFGVSNAGLASLVTSAGGATYPTALAIGTVNNTPIVFGVNGAEIGRMTATGLNNMIIGATTPNDGYFDFVSSARTDGDYEIKVSNNSDVWGMAVSGVDGSLKFDNIGLFGGALSLAKTTGQPAFKFLATAGVVVNDVTTGKLNTTTSLPVGYLAAGAGATSSTFWRGDGTWATPSGAGNVSVVGTPTSGMAAEWTGATTIQGVSTTGTGSYVKGNAPTIVGGSITGLTSLALRDTSAAFDVTLAATSVVPLTAGRTLTFDVSNANRTLKLTGNSIVNQDVSTGGSPSFVQVTSIVPTGAQPFVVTSTTAVDHLNASLLLGNTWAAPGTIGGGTAGIVNASVFNGPGTGLTGTAASLTAGNVTTNANQTGDVTSVGNATTYAGIVPVAKGGTNLSSYTTGDLLYASGATTLSKLSDVALGSMLISGGTGAAPAWSPLVKFARASGASATSYGLVFGIDGTDYGTLGYNNSQQFVFNQDVTALSMNGTPIGLTSPNRGAFRAPTSVGEGLTVYSPSTSSGTDSPALYVQRTATHTGGAPYYVDNAAFLRSDVGANVTNFEWTLTSVLNNSATAGQNVAIYGQATKNAANVGPTFAGVFEFAEHAESPNPTTSSVILELDLEANGTDTHNQRIGVDLQVGKPGGIGTANSIYSAYTIHNGGDAADNVKYAFQTNIITDTAFDAHLATSLTRALWSQDNSPIAFSTDGLFTLGYYSSGTKFVFKNNTTSLLSLDSSGAMITGSYINPGTTVKFARASGASATSYGLVFGIDGTDYGTLGYNNSQQFVFNQDVVTSGAFIGAGSLTTLAASGTSSLNFVRIKDSNSDGTANSGSLLWTYDGTNYINAIANHFAGGSAAACLMKFLVSDGTTTGTVNPLTLYGDGHTAVTGAITSTASGQFLSRTGTSTASQYINIANTSGSTFFGVENSAGTTFGATAYATVINDQGVGEIDLNTSGVKRVAVTSAGIAVTGQLAVTQSAGTYAAVFQAGSTTGSSFGPIVKAGTNSSDTCMDWYATNGSTQLAHLSGAGAFNVASTINSSGFARVTGDVTNATATMSNLSNLSVTVASGVKYIGTVQIFANDSTNTDGLAFDLGGGSATFTDLEFGFAAQPAGSTLGTVTSTTSTTAVTLTVVSTSDAVYTLSFGFTCNAGGTFIPRFAQNGHTTGTATVRKNSGINLVASTN